MILVTGIILFYTGLNEGFFSSNSTIQAIFKGITYLGEPVVFLVIVVILYLTYNKKFAKNLLISLLTSYYLNQLVKSIFKDPRPSTNIDPTEDYGLIETSYGFPSGHTQNATTFWGYLGFGFKDHYRIKNSFNTNFTFTISVSCRDIENCNGSS